MTNQILTEKRLYQEMLQPFSASERRDTYMDLDGIINDAIFELTNNAVNKLRETDTELDAAIIRATELSETVRDIIEKLPDSEQAVINEYHDLKAEADDKQFVECYKQGARDCVAILKKLGVI